MKFRKFTCTVFIFLLFFLAFNLVVWTLWTNKVVPTVTATNPNGDLSRLGYLLASKLPRTNEVDLPHRHLDFSDWDKQPVDVVTIGDSFSNGGGGGKNCFYQDFIASNNNLRVLNIPQYEGLNKVTTASILSNSGYLAKMNPKAVIIECAEKTCWEEVESDLTKSVSDKDLAQYEAAYSRKANDKTDKMIKLDFVTDANFKLVRNSILYNFSENAFMSQVYKVKLDRPFFTAAPDTLLFYHADIKHLKKNNSESIAGLNDVLNKLSDKLNKQDVKLYFMPCVDKYNLFSEYIINNKHSKSIFFEELRKLPKRYDLIDTKALLSEELSKGVKDVYYPDDTHWSWKASKKIFDSVKMNN